MIQEERLVQLFKELCLIDAPPLKEKDSVAFTKKYLKDMGLEVYEDNAGEKIGGNANNLIACLKGNNKNAPKIFFSAHFDTVEPTKGLIIEEKEGGFYSASDTILGADDKGGMAPAIEAVNALKDSDASYGDVYLLLTVAEEIGLKGAEALELEKWDLDYGYVLDTGPPVGTFVNRAATHDALNFKIVGKPAHAGKAPEEGVSAIQVFADAVSNMKLGLVENELTANIGVVRGGEATNVVCPEVIVQAEARSTDEMKLDKQIQHMTDEMLKAGEKWGAKIEVEHYRHYTGYLIDPCSEVLRIGQKSSEKLGLDSYLRTNLGGSDASAFNKKGVPTVVMATGMEKIHTHDEHISRKDLIDTTKLCLEIILEAGSK